MRAVAAAGTAFAYHDVQLLSCPPVVAASFSCMLYKYLANINNATPSQYKSDLIQHFETARLVVNNWFVRWWRSCSGGTAHSHSAISQQHRSWIILIGTVSAGANQAEIREWNIARVCPRMALMWEQIISFGATPTWFHCLCEWVSHLCGHSSACPSCRDCQAGHRSVSLSESAPF